MGRRGGGFHFLLIFFAAGLAPALGQQGYGSQAIARAWFEEARALAEAGDWASAAIFLEEARFQDPADSDARYLSAMAGLKTGASINDALSELGAALASARFTDYESRDAFLLRAELLVRLRRFPEALATLADLPRSRADDGAERLLRARALRGAGEREAYLAELASAMARLPDDPSFPRLFLEHPGQGPDGSEAKAVAELLLGRLARYAALDPELPVLAVSVTPEASARRDAVLAFRAAGRRSAAATLRALEYGMIDESAAASEIFSGAYPAMLRDLESALALSGGPKGREALLSAFASWSGELGSDRDGDGVVEETLACANGAAVSWSRDGDQDGIADIRVSFSEGSPVYAEIYVSDHRISVSYTAFPSVSSLSIISEDEERIYAFAPESLSFSPVVMRALGEQGRGSSYLPSPTLSPAPTERACVDAALTLTVNRGGERSVIVLEKGVPLSRRGYSSGKLISELEYARGRPSLERIDADGDGRFETERGYEGGEDPVSARVDADGDGIFEFSESSVFPFLKEWDFDADGRYDARQYFLPDGAISREFSSRLDGDFDEALTLRDGRIVSFRRGGSEPALVPDANPALTWIGPKPFDLGDSSPLAEGVFSRGSTRYCITIAGGRAFAEVLP